VIRCFAPRCFAPMIGLLGALTPALAHAQTNLDQGKSASQIFASACAECHKDAHGLGKGKNSAGLTDFLREHYTTNGQQAAALAAYIMGGRGGEPIGAAAQGRGQKPAAQRASVSTEEPKPAKHQAKQSAKPDDGKPADGKPQRSTHEAAKPKDDASPGEQPGLTGPIVAPEVGPHERRPTAARGHRNEPKAPQPPQEPAAIAHAPAPVVTEPVPAETPSSEGNTNPSPAAAAPAAAASGEPGENAPVPRDNVPD
jgi:hypothetical protein